MSTSIMISNVGRIFVLANNINNRVATSWKSPGFFFCCPGKSWNFV